MKESGQLDKKWLKWTSIHKTDCFPVQSEPVGIWNIIGAFGLLGIGIFVSVFVMALEYLFSKKMPFSD